MSRKTPKQEEFDCTAHGWAFCNHEMLGRKLSRLREISSRLPLDDHRHETLAAIERTFSKGTPKNA